MTYVDVFKKSDALINKLGEEKAHIVWVMARYLDEPDLEALAAAALTDGPNDKKIDFIYLDHDAKRLILTQGYFSGDYILDKAGSAVHSGLHRSKPCQFSTPLFLLKAFQSLAEQSFSPSWMLSTLTGFWTGRKSRRFWKPLLSA